MSLYPTEDDVHILECIDYIHDELLYLIQRIQEEDSYSPYLSLLTTAAVLMPHTYNPSHPMDTMILVEQVYDVCVEIEQNMRDNDESLTYFLPMTRIMSDLRWLREELQTA